MDYSSQVPARACTRRINGSRINGDIFISFYRENVSGRALTLFNLQLTVEDYVHVMEMLTNDLRFTLYNICYKRVLVLWIFTAFVVLLGLLFSGVQGLTLFSLGVMWLVLNSAAIFLCMWIKIKVGKSLK